MMIARLLCLLLVPLFAVGSVGVAGEAMVLCIADTHIAVEVSRGPGPCIEVCGGATTASDSPFALAADCVDVELGTGSERVVPERRNVEVSQLLPTVALSGTLLPSPPRYVGPPASSRATEPSAHLLPLRSFLLLI